MSGSFSELFKVLKQKELPKDDPPFPIHPPVETEQQLAALKKSFRTLWHFYGFKPFDWQSNERNPKVAVYIPQDSV